MFYAARQAIVRLFESAKDAMGLAAHQIFYPGEKDVDQQDSRALHGSPWVRVSVFVVEARRIEMGPTAQRRTEGRIVVQVFTPDNMGDGQALELADKVAKTFTDVNSVAAYDPDDDQIRVGTVRFRTASVIPVGVDTAGNHPQYLVNVEVPYQYDYVNTGA